MIMAVGLTEVPGHNETDINSLKCNLRLYIQLDLNVC